MHHSSGKRMSVCGVDRGLLPPPQVHVSWKTKAILNSTVPRAGRHSSDLRDPRGREDALKQSRLARVCTRAEYMYAYVHVRMQIHRKVDRSTDRPTDRPTTLEYPRVLSITLEYSRTCSRTKRLSPPNLQNLPTRLSSTRRGTENGRKWFLLQNGVGAGGQLRREEAGGAESRIRGPGKRRCGRRGAPPLLPVLAVLCSTLPVLPVPLSTPSTLGSRRVCIRSATRCDRHASNVAVAV